MAKKQQEEKTGINSSEFSSAISQICDEKGIDKEKVMETVEAALAAAYKKDYGKKSQNIRAELDQVSGQVNFFLVKEVVDETVREIIDFSETEGDDPEKSSDLGAEGSKDEGKKKDSNTKKEEKTDKKTELDEEKIPRFNPERDILMEDAKDIKKKVKIGDVIETKLETHEDYGRVAAQTAKQVIIQRIREAEKDAMYAEYKEKEGEVLNGTVQRVEGHNIFIDLGKATGVLFPSEQVKGENYRIGQRLKVYLGKIEADTRGPGIVLSRTHENLVKKLFELEVPEIFSGTVEIKSISREAGSRTKIAVVATEDGIDPIGSCVGQKGTRVQAIIDELGGEKIDIIEWNEDIEKFIAASLSPAKVIAIQIKKGDEKNVAVTVPDDQLSLAIGQKGQNVRLAAKLTGYKIDVLGEEGVKDVDEKETQESTDDETEKKKSSKKEEVKDDKKKNDKKSKTKDSKKEELKEEKK